MELNKAACEAATGAFINRLTDRPATSDLLAALRFALEAYESVRVAPAPASQQEAGGAAWISALDAAPAWGDVVLMTDGEDVAAGRWYPTGWAFHNFLREPDVYLPDGKITHWKPLPPPPDLTSRAQRTNESK